MSVSLYRKYRPTRFEDVVGQGHITRTLTNAIHQDRVSHAYLFAGPRGTGKTSTAKILAMALNCQAGGGRATADPDGTCAHCEAIRRGFVHGRARDRRRIEPGHRRDPRDPRPGELRPRRRTDEGLHRRRSPHADPGSLQRPAQDAGRAARARGVRARHHRAPPGTPHHPLPLPALRLPPAVGAGDRAGADVGGRAGGHRGLREHPVGDRPSGGGQLPRRHRYARSAGRLLRGHGHAAGRTGHPRRGRAGPPVRAGRHRRSAATPRRPSCSWRRNRRPAPTSISS